MNENITYANKINFNPLDKYVLLPVALAELEQLL